jgi:hypothetical protein
MWRRDVMLCVVGKTRTVNHREIVVPQQDWVSVLNTHEPIVSRKAFNAVQKMAADNAARDAAKRHSQGAYTPSVFGGKVFCARCGHATHRHRQNKDGTYWYRCQSKWNLQKAACVVVSVKESDLKLEILAILHKQSEALLGRHITLHRAEIPAQNSADAALREINRELDKDGRMVKSLYENMVTDVISRDEFVQLKTDYESKIAALSVRADAVRNARRTSKTQSAQYLDFADAVSTALHDDALTAELIGRLVEKILVHPDKSFEVIFKFGDDFGEVA